MFSEQDLSGIVEAAEEVQSREERIIRDMKEGASLFHYLNFDEHYDKVANQKPSQLRFMIGD